jgi:DNA-binding SARP family transcriptional activator/pimeloyl-ACP methyl ester carboxylesterase
MRISILGPLEVRSAAGDLCLPRGGKQRLLLAALLLTSPRVVPTDRLAELLWPDQPPADPTAALRTQISRLRSSLQAAGCGDDPVRSEPYGYRFEANGIDLDSRRFQALLAEGREADGSEEELRILREALALWRGDAYEEFSDIPFFMGAVRNLGELRMGARERLVEGLLDLGRTSEALSEAQSLVHLDPLRERPRALFMRALYRAGRQHEALAQYQEFRRLLSDELGLDPSPSLRELESAILRHEARERSDPAAGKPLGDPSSHRNALPSSTLRQEIRFCRSRDGVRLAFATVGGGPPLVKAANWLNHLEFDWESPVWRRLFQELGSRHLLVRYDERGSGLSDRDPEDLSLDAWVLDLEAVVDACGLDRFPLLGISQGCAVCVEYAARHPDRVSGLILHGGYAAGWRVDPGYSPAEVSRRDASIEIIRHGWGEDIPAYRQMFTQTFIPGGTREEIDWFNELERRSTSPENAARFMEAFAVIDVRHRLGQVRAPTLVLHSRGDQRIHYDRGRELATGIPVARFVLLESRNHLILEHEPAFRHWMDEALRFLREEVAC